MRADESNTGPKKIESPFASFVRRKGARGPRVALLLISVLAVASAGGFMVLRSRQAAPIPPADGEAIVAASELASSEPAKAASAPSIEVPALDESDGVVRQLVARLSAHPQFARWLVTDELVRRFVRSVVELAHGGTPAPHVRFVAPPGAFEVREVGAEIIVDPASYGRYDRIAETFASIDTEGAALLFRQLHPRFEEAYAEIGLPGGSFDGDFARAVANVLAVHVPQYPLALVRSESTWQYADAELEAGSAAAKQLMRMGPRNAQRLQSKLAELAEAIGVLPAG